MKTKSNGRVIDNRSKLLFVFCSFHFIDDGFSDSLYLLLPFISAELHLSLSQVGLLKGMFSFMNLLQFPISVLGEKFGELTVISMGTLGLTSGFLFVSAGGSFLVTFVSLILARGTSAGQHGVSSAVISRVFEFSHRRTAMGVFNFSGDMGKVSLPFLMAIMLNVWHWRTAVTVLAVCGMAAGIFLWISARQQKMPSRDFPSEKERSFSKGNWGIVDRRRFAALLTIGILDISTRSALLTFLPFLLLQKDIPGGQVSFALTLLFAGGAAGKFLCGVLAERLGVRPMVIGTEVLTAGGIFFLMIASPLLSWLVLPIVGFVLNGTSSVLYATVAEIISPQGRSRGYGLYYAVTLGCGSLAPMIFGLLTDLAGLSFSISGIGAMALITIPLCRYMGVAEKIA